MADLETVLADVARRLHSARIPYMVIGGLANAAWGVPRSTLDIDITVPARLGPLADQLLRAAASVPANLAEGRGRSGRDRVRGRGRNRHRNRIRVRSRTRDRDRRRIRSRDRGRDRDRAVWAESLRPGGGHVPFPSGTSLTDTAWGPPTPRRTGGQACVPPAIRNPGDVRDPAGATRYPGPSRKVRRRRCGC